MKNLIQKVTHELILTLKKKASEAVETEQLRAKTLQQTKEIENLNKHPSTS